MTASPGTGCARAGRLPAARAAYGEGRRSRAAPRLLLPTRSCLRTPRLHRQAQPKSEHLKDRDDRRFG